MARYELFWIVASPPDQETRLSVPSRMGVLSYLTTTEQPSGL